MNLHEQPRGIIALAWLCLVATILHASLGCRHPEPEKPAPRVVVERRACADTAPPAPIVVELAGPAEGCPAPLFAGCLKRQQLVDLIRYLNDIARWARRAFTACGPLPTTPGDPTP